MNKTSKHEMFDRLRKVSMTLNYLRGGFLANLPKGLAKKFDEQMYIGGGSIYSLYNTGSYKDIDIFVRSENLIEELEKYLLSNYHFQNKRGVLIGTLEYGIQSVITDNAITIGKYQVVKRDFGEPVDVVSRFDFKHNMFWHDVGIVEGLVNFDMLEANNLYMNELRPRHMAGVLMRVAKYTNRGMVISRSEMSKIILKMQDTGLEDFEIKSLKEFSRFDS